MRFSGQKFFILLGLFLIPFLFVGAMLREPVVNQGLLKITMALLKHRLGTGIRARGWKVDLSRFAVAIEGIETQYKDVKVSVAELRAEFSPLFLIFGRVYLSKVWLDEVKFSGKLEVPAVPLSKETFDIEKFLNSKAHEIIGLQNWLDAKKMGFESAEISDLSADLNLFKIQNADISLENYGTGHIKLELSLDGLSESKKIPDLHQLTLAAVILNDRNGAYLSLRHASFELANRGQVHTTFDLRGRVPGDVSFEVGSNLASFKQWAAVQKIAELKDLSAKNLAGILEARGTLRVQGTGISQVQGELRAKSLQFDDFAMRTLGTRFDYSNGVGSVSELEAEFPSTRMDPEGSANHFSIQHATFDKEKISGAVDFSKMSLCALLRGLGVSECHTTVRFSGNMQLAGITTPFKLVPTVNLNVDPFEVYTDPDTPTAPAGGRLLRTQALHVSGSVELREKEMDFTKLQVTAGTTKADVTGSMKYSPTKLTLKIMGEQVHFEELLDDFLGQKIAGLARVDSTIDYDFQRDRKKGKTDILADYFMRNISVTGLPLGDAVGKVQYTGKILNFTPIFRMGPGVLKLTGHLGRLQADSTTSELSLEADANDYEVLVPRRPGQAAIFDGIANFKTLLRGSLQKGAANPFGGKIDINFNSLSTYGVPFDRGTLHGYVDLKGLRIDQLVADKGEVSANLNGFLGAENSFVEFQSGSAAIRQLGYEPSVERLFQSGVVQLKGSWHQKRSWNMQLDARELRIGTTSFPPLTAKIGAEKDEASTLHVSGGDQISLDIHPTTHDISGHLKDSGIFLALILLNRWETVPDDLKVQGDLALHWASNEGKIDLQSLDFEVDDRWNHGERGLLELQNPSTIIWKDKVFKGSADFTSAGKTIRLRGDGPLLRLDGEVALRLFDFFLPEMIRLTAGLGKISGQWNPGHADENEVNLSTADARIFVPAIGTEFSPATAHLRFKEGRLFFDDISSKAGDGNATIKGFWSIEKKSMDIQMTTSNLPMRFGREVELSASGSLQLKGDARPYDLTGQMRVERGILRKEFADNSVPIVNLETPFLKFNIPFDLAPNFLVKNTLTESTITGQGKLLGSENNPFVSGHFEVVKGSLLARDNDFQITFGKIVIPENKSDPINVNVQANTVKSFQNADYRIFLEAKGNPKDLKVDFRSEPTLDNKDVISLLTIGYIPQEQAITSTNNQNGMASGASAEAFQMLFGQALGQGIHKETGFDVRLGTSADLKQEDTIPKVTVYRQLNDRTSATFGKSLDNSRPENNFKVDYRLLDNLNLTGVWENPDENTNSLGVDLRVKFEIK